jgi:hypothetical protein
MIMKKRTGIILTLLMFIAGIQAFMPGEVKATAPTCNPADCGGGYSQLCYQYGDYTCYSRRTPPARCAGGQPVPPYRPAGFVMSTGSKPPSTPSQSVKKVEPESAVRQTSATVLSILILLSGLAALVLCIRKIFRQLYGLPTRRHRRVRFNSFHLRPAGIACLIALLGLVPGVWLSTLNTSASPVPPVRLPVAGLSETQQSNICIPGFSSALQIGGTGGTQIGGTAIDTQGNIYVTGGFTQSLTFNTLPQPTTLTSTQDFDFFIAKFDPMGKPVWARQANGATELPPFFAVDGGLTIAVDAQGNTYVGGGFVKSLAFKNASGNTVATLSDDSDADSDEINFEVFVAKYNAGGTLVWARGGHSGAMDDPDAEEDLDAGINGITEIVIDAAGNPYVAGIFSGDNFLGEEITGEGGRDIVLSRLNPVNGDPVWISTPGSVSTDGVSGLAIDAAANLYIIGEIGATITFPTLPTPTTFVIDDEFGDSFVAKYNQNGQALWAKQIGGNQPIEGTHIAVNSSGQLYLTGAFEGEADFDSIPVNDPSNGSGSSGFLAKYTTEGNALWVRSFGHFTTENPEGDVLGYRVAVDGEGNPYVSGIFEGEATFGYESPGMGQTLISNDLNDQFITHYDAAGNFKWVKQPSGSSSESANPLGYEGMGMEILPMRLVYNTSAKAIMLTGDFLGTLTLDNITLNSGGQRDAFAASISVVDTLAPTMACPATFIANTVNAGEAAVAVNFTAPVASDNCAVASVVCVPPAGSSFPRGTTPVTCTASDTSNNKTTCSFSVRVFDYVIADDTNGKLLRFNSVTGDYEFFDCRKTLTLSGRGTVTMSSCKTELRASGADRNLLVQANPCTRKGNATLTYAKVTHTLSDVNLSSNRASCP